jgi:hypothetical protein
MGWYRLDCCGLGQGLLEGSCQQRYEVSGPTKYKKVIV